MIKQMATSVWIKNREHKVLAESGVVKSGPFPGGVYRELKNQDGQNAKLARKLASGAQFSEHAFTSIRIYQ